MSNRARKRPNGGFALPYKGPFKVSNENDLETGSKQVNQVHIDILNISDKEEHAQDREKYERICKLSANGVAYISKEKEEWLPEKECWKVFLRWVRFVEMDKDHAEKELLDLSI